MISKEKKGKRKSRMLAEMQRRSSCWESWLRTSSRDGAQMQAGFGHGKDARRAANGSLVDLVLVPPQPKMTSSPKHVTPRGQSVSKREREEDWMR